MATPQVGAIGVSIELTVKDNNVIVDVSPATNLKIYIEPPNQVAVEYTGSFKTNGSDGIIRYVTTASTDLPISGYYRAQAGFTLAGFTGRTSSARFYVRPNLV